VEIYTISGASDVQLLGPVPPCSNASALKVAGGVTRVGSLGLGGYGVYKAFGGGWGPAALSLAGAVALWFSGSRLLRAAGLAEDSCGASK
jgi:hypothetical protein